MPYAMPSPPSPTGQHLDLPPLKLRPKHRRTRSATPTFSNERGQGAFSSLPHLPRRKSGDRKAMFHIRDEQDSDSSDDMPMPPSNSLGLTVDTKNVPSNIPAHVPMNPPAEVEQTSTLPFPSRGSPLPSPQPQSPRIGSPIQRTPSTPIILSNGKPLKPSLKSSQSSPHIPGLHIHTRAQSEPCTPSGAPVPKNVHFAEKEALQSVRVFNSSGKPANVSRPLADETETETEYDSSNPASFPFPSAPSAQDLTFELNPETTSTVPNAKPPAYANVHLETLVFPPTRPPMLRGSILVRNVAYAKEVALRFTMDNWQTTSEVTCKHVVSLPSLPPPFPSPRTPGDRAAADANSSMSAWDRFSFVIRLEDFERKLAEKNIVMVVRFTAPGVGEWWDNNAGNNYHVGFRKAAGGKEGGAAMVSDPSRMSPVMGNSQQRTFSAPPTLKGTPTTEAVQAVANAVPPSTPKLSLPLHFSGRRHAASAPARPSPPIRSNSSPQPLTMAAMDNANDNGNGNGDSTPPSPMRASLPTKLNLLNYAAPARSPLSASSTGSPYTRYFGGDRPDEHDRNHTVTLNSPTSRDPPGQQMSIVGGMPATGAPRYEFPWPSSNNSSSQSLSPPPSPPPSYSYYSPPAPAPSAYEKQRAKEIVSSPTSSLATDSSYAAFVKQWCFAQSPTPTPGTQMSGGVGAGASSGTSGSVRPLTHAGNGWCGADVEPFNGVYGGSIRSDSPMLASI